MAISRKSKMASKNQDGYQNLKSFRCIIYLTLSRLKFKIWYQSDSKLLKYGKLKKIKDDFQNTRCPPKLIIFSCVTYLTPTGP